MMMKLVLWSWDTSDDDIGVSLGGDISDDEIGSVVLGGH